MDLRNNCPKKHQRNDLGSKSSVSANQNSSDRNPPWILPDSPSLQNNPYSETEKNPPTTHTQLTTTSMQSSKLIIFLVLIFCLLNVLLASKRKAHYRRHHKTTTNKVSADSASGDAEKLNLDVYYETGDFFSLQFITTEVYPTMKAQGLSEIINLRLIPFGKANETIGKNNQYQFKCDHGSIECEGNMYQACAIALKGNNSAEALPFIDCMSFNLYERFLDPLPAAHDCAPHFDIDTVQLDACVNGELGNQVMHQMALATKSIKTLPLFPLPWMGLNGQTTEWVKNNMEFNMRQFVCYVYEGPKPAGCKQF